MPSCVGFVDETRIIFCRHRSDAAYQRCFHSGNKLVHCLSYLYVTIPDCLTFSYSDLWRVDSPSQYCTPNRIYNITFSPMF